MKTAKTDMRAELLENSPWELMLKLSVPAIIGMLVIGLYSLVDAVYVGQLIGPSAMGAISVVYPFTLINSGIATLIGIGSASVLSRAIGRKDTETIDRIMGNLLLLILILSAASTLAGMIFTRQLLALSGAEGEILELGVRYMRVVFAGSVLINFAQSANMILRAQGLMKHAMVLMGIGAVLVMLLCPVFILAMGERGIEGSALANIVAQLVQVGLTLHYFLKKNDVVRFHGIRLAFSLLPEILSVGVSAMMMQVMTLVQQTVLYNMASRHGGDAQIILIGAALRVMAFSFIPLWGMSQGMQPVVGTNYGARQYERVRKSANTFFIGATLLALCFWIPIQLFPEAILSMFIKDAAIVAQGTGNFRLMFSIFPTLGIMIMALTFFQAIGKGGQASLLVILRQIALFVPLAVLLPRVMGITGVWAASPITDGAVLILSAAMVAMEYKKLRQAGSTLNAVVQ
jgi:putative MATE family efflux protein